MPVPVAQVMDSGESGLDSIALACHPSTQTASEALIGIWDARGESGQSLQLTGARGIWVDHRPRRHKLQ
jgi:hypothetical protein